jgi:tetratricopeptide (TPR) repeat protein
MDQYRQALRIKPDCVEACTNLGNALLQSGRVDEAVAQYQEALRIRPGFSPAYNQLIRLQALPQPAGAGPEISFPHQPWPGSPRAQNSDTGAAGGTR